MSRAPVRRFGGAGRQRAGVARTARIGGVEIAYEDGLDENLKNRVQPAETFPLYNPKKPQALTMNEQEEVARFLQIRKRFRDGPFYAAIGTKKPSAETAFESMGSYSRKYTKPTLVLPQLDTKKRAQKQFPSEIWSVITSTKVEANTSFRIRKRPPQARVQPAIKVDLPEDDEEVEENVDEENLEAEIDDEYESNEEEMAGDYNAERYFEGGEETLDDWEGDGDGDNL